MTIKKGDNIYMVKELKEKWKVSKGSDNLSLSFDVSKELCSTWDELYKYVLSNELFS